MSGQQPHGGNLASSVEGLLSSFGLASSDTRTTVEDVAAARFRDLGYDVEVDSLRYGTLAVSCDAVTAHLLTYDRQQLLETLDAELRDTVTALRIRVNQP